MPAQEYNMMDAKKIKHRRLRTGGVSSLSWKNCILCAMLSKNVFKYIQSLKLKKHRDEEQRFIAEGPKVISELLMSTAFRPARVYSLPAYAEANRKNDPDVEWHEVSEAELERLSLLQAPQQALAVAPTLYHPFAGFQPGTWSIMLDGIQDPGNLGTIIRIADWFGVSHIYATPDTADCYNPKVVQASMGSLFRVKMHYGDCSGWLADAKVPVYGTAMQGESIWTFAKPEPGILIIGNEGKGMRPEIRGQLTTALTIPRIGHAESLNAGVATGIILSHLLKPS